MSSNARSILKRNTSQHFLYNIEASQPFAVWGVDMFALINMKTCNDHQSFGQKVESDFSANTMQRVIRRPLKGYITCHY